jgi:WD40 repeat protein
VATGKRLGPKLVAEALPEGDVRGAEFSADGKVILIFTQNVARVWEVSTGKPLAGPIASPEGIVRASLSLDGKMVLTSSSTRAFQLWSTVTGKALGRALWEDEKKQVEISPDGKALLLHNNEEWHLLDTATGRFIGPLRRDQGPKEGNLTIDFRPDGRVVVATGKDGTTRFWETATGQAFGRPIVHPHRLAALVWSSDGEKCLARYRNGTAQLFGPRRGERLGPALAFWAEGGGEGAHGAALSPDGRTVVAWDAWLVALLDTATGKRLVDELRPGGGKLLDCSFSPDGRRLLVVRADGKANLYDARTAKPIGDYLPVLLPEEVYRLTKYARLPLVFSPDGRTILTASVDEDAVPGFGGKAQLWDTEMGTPTGKPMRHPKRIRAVAFSPDGQTIATGSEDRTVQLWDAATCTALGPPLPHLGPVMKVDFSADGKTLLAGYGAQIATSYRLWDVTPGVPDEPDRAELWAQVLTRKRLADDGTVHDLDDETWQRLRRRLDRGGP